MSLLGNLLPATFRGVPFAVIDQSVNVGRRVALHEYPGRDEPWAEDMGRGARRIRFRGFIVENDPIYAGGPIALQRLALVAAAEMRGAGVLTHPTLGLLRVVCEAMSVTEGLDGARFSVIEFAFVEAGKQGLPNLFATSFGISPDVLSGALGALAAVRVIALAGTSGSGAADGSLPICSRAWSAQVQAAGTDATALSRLAATLPGNRGRYSRGATAGYLAQAGETADSYPELVALAADLRASIASAAARLDAVVAALTVSTDEADYADAVAALVAALTAACADPRDALRLLGQLLTFRPDVSTPAARVIAALFVNVVTVELTRAAAAYQPASYEDAFARLVEVTGALDAAILAAGDAGHDDLFAALRALRVQVVADLRARGATLAHVRTFATPAPLPAIVLAQRLYLDPARADELVGEAGRACVSPLFMPTTIQALAA